MKKSGVNRRSQWAKWKKWSGAQSNGKLQWTLITELLRSWKHAKNRKDEHWWCHWANYFIFFGSHWLIYVCLLQKAHKDIIVMFSLDSDYCGPFRHYLIYWHVPTAIVMMPENSTSFHNIRYKLGNVEVLKLSPGTFSVKMDKVMMLLWICQQVTHQMQHEQMYVSIDDLVLL